MTKKIEFAHIHSHTDHSVLDGHASVKDLAQYAFDMGQPGFAVTDHGSMSNVYNAVKAAEAISKTHGVPFKCAPGIEAYVTPGDASMETKEPIFFSKGSRENKEERSNDVSGGGAYTHMTMVAETSEGMHNLFKLSSLSWEKGYFRKPRMDIESIAAHSQGIIATTGCPSGELQTRLRLGQWKEAMEYASKMQDIFGKENYYLELMDHNMSIDLERAVRGDLMKVAKELGIPLLATNDLHYVRKEDARDQEHMLCINSGSSMRELPYEQGGKRFAFEGTEYYAKTTEEMLRLFPEDLYPGAIQNSAEIVKRSSAQFEYDATLRPTVPLPDGHDEHSYLRELSFEGLRRKRPEKANDPEYIARLEKELGILREKDFSGYMLVVSDFMVWAQNNGVITGPGRGCLSGDTLIPTTNGTKRLDEIVVGDVIYDENGQQVEVPAVYEWDCDEELIEVSSYYGGQPIKMTADHKVLVSKANRELTTAQKSSGYSYGKEHHAPEWIRADEIEVGDLVANPRLEVKDTFKGVEVELESTAHTTLASEVSSRAIHRATGLSRNAIKSFFDGKTVLPSTREKIEAHLQTHGVTAEEALARRKVTSVLELDSTFIEANHDLGFMFGLFISDGWLRSRGHELGFAQRRSEDENIIPDTFRRVFGAELSVADHATNDLRQYRTSHQGVIKVFKDLFPEYRHTASTKYIPAQLLESNEEFRRGLLDGLWYGDGSFKGKTSYSTTSERLANDVYRLLMTLGIHAGVNRTVRTESRPEFNKSGRESYMEYKVIASPTFDEYRVINGMGVAFDGNYSYNRVRNVRTVPAEGKVYDFRVDTTQSYLTESFIVHNSGGGSLVAFCTDIVQIDPVEHGLIFERFLNPERDSPPDIDSDFDDANREKVIEYVRRHYGEEMVAQIITFGLIKAKSAIKDIARIYEEPFSVGETLTKAMPEPIAGKDISLKEIYDPNSKRYHEAERFREEASKLDNKNLIQDALGIEGKMRSTGVHAAGVIMSSKPLRNTIPLMTRQKDMMTVTQFDYPTCEALGLIKMDFLGLRNLTVIDKCVSAIKRNHGIDIVPQEIYDTALTDPDQKTFDLINAGRTLGVFQLDSAPITALAKQIHVTSFNDISAILALYRPGPMGMESHTKYADRKNGREAVEPIHPELAEPIGEILGETYGLCVAGDTKVWDATDGKLVRVDSIEDAVKDGDFYTFSMGKNGTMEPKRVTHWFHTGRKEIISISTEDGRTLRVSPDHPVLTVNGWKKAGELDGTERLSTSKNTFSPREGSSVSVEEARLIGYLVGDGYITLKANTFTNSCVELTSHVEDLASKLFDDCYLTHTPRERDGRVYTTHSRFGTSPAGVGKGNGKRNTFLTSKLNTWLREKMGYKSKTLSEHKHVPEAILGAGIDEVRHFLAALWDCDGHVSARSSYLKTISSDLAYGVQMLLDRCGIHSAVLNTGTYTSTVRGERATKGVYVHGPKFWNDIVPLMKHPEKSNVKYQFDGWTRFEGISYFNMREQMHPLVIQRGVDKGFSPWMIKKITNNVPGPKALSLYLSEQGWMKDTPGYKINSAYLKHGFAPLSPATNTYLEHLGTPEDKRNANLYWNRIKKIEVLPEEDVYDITVEDNHNFLANGIVIHNCVFQEQIQFIAQKVSNYSLGQADMLRRAMGKKKKEILDAEFKPFSEGMKKNGYSDNAIEALWNTLVPFAEYGFNKSHSAAYGLISYLTAYLKANYGPEFMAANLSTLTDNKEKTAMYLAECRRMGIKVLPPDVSHSTTDYTATKDGNILVGLQAIRGVGFEVATAVFNESAENGPYESLDDFMGRAPANALSKSALEGFAHSGALDSFGYSRRALHTQLPDVAGGFAKARKKQDTGQFSLFDDVEEAEGPGVDISNIPEYVKKDKLMFERHALGLYVSDHPLSGIANMLDRFSDTKVADIASGSVRPSAGFSDRQRLRLAGVVNNLVKKPTRTGAMFALFELEDITGSVPCIVFPKTFDRIGAQIEADTIYEISGSLLAGDGEDDVKFAVDSVKLINMTESGLIPFEIHLRMSQAQEEAIKELESVLRVHPGQMPVHLHLTNAQGKLQVFELGDHLRVEGNNDLAQEIRALFGSGAIR